jgi:hypothetical protein
MCPERLGRVACAKWPNPLPFSRLSDGPSPAYLLSGRWLECWSVTGKARAAGAPICAGQGSLTPQLPEAPGGRGVRWWTVAFLLALTVLN